MGCLAPQNAAVSYVADFRRPFLPMVQEAPPRRGPLLDPLGVDGQAWRFIVNEGRLKCPLQDFCGLADPGPLFLARYRAWCTSLAAFRFLACCMLLTFGGAHP